MAAPIRFGLIGVGGVGGYHWKAIDALAAEGRAELRAVADPTVARLPEEHAALTARGVPWHLDYREMLREAADLDAVTIATPIPFHLEMARACLERGVFVHLEKPPVPLIQQLDELIAADPESKVAVGFQMITARSTEELKCLVVSGALGEIQHLRACGCWPRLDGYYRRATWAGKMTLRGEPVFDGPATNALAHLIHNIMFLASSAPGEFDAPIEVRAELYRARPEIECYDGVCLRGSFASGVTFSAAFTHVTEEALPFELKIIGSKGEARIANDGALVESSGGRIDCPETTIELLIKSTRHFIDFIEGKRPRLPTRLRDTRGYVLATNGALVSSGGIRPLDAKWLRAYERNSERGYDVAGLADAVRASFETGQLFSELGVPWAIAPQPVPLGDFRTLDFTGYAPR